MAIYSINYINEVNQYQDISLIDILNESLSEMNNLNIDLYASILEADVENAKYKVKEAANNIIESIRKFFRDIIAKIKNLSVYTKLNQLKNEIKSKMKANNSVKEVYSGLPSLTLYKLDPKKVINLIASQVKNIDGNTSSEDINKYVKDCEPYFSTDEENDRNSSSNLRVKGNTVCVFDAIVEKGCDEQKLMSLLDDVQKSIGVYEKIAKDIESNFIENTKKAIYALDRNDPDFSYKFKGISNRRLFLTRFMGKFLTGITNITQTNERNIRKYFNDNL